MALRPGIVSRSNIHAKPKVLLVDDHPGVLDAVAATLATDFDVVGIARSGEQAIDMARTADPDVVVLDITMPGLDGFQTFRALTQAGSRARGVFLSMYDADEYVAEAFGCGGRGYVLKTRIRRDLGSALDHVLAGRLFVPSLTSLLHLSDGTGHAMQLHGDEGSFFNGLAAGLDTALRRGDATCVIASERMREGISERLRARGWDVGGSTGHPRCLMIDAGVALTRVMRDGLLDEASLAEIADELNEYRLANGEGPSPRLALFGNMVVSLVMNGNLNGAIALERVWNTLTSGLPFFTLCGYSMDCFHDERHPDFFSNTCAEHWAVSHALGA